MVTEGKCRLFKRKDGKYLIYIPLALCTDSMFPFKVKPNEENESHSIELHAWFDIGKNRLIIEKKQQ